MRLLLFALVVLLSACGSETAPAETAPSETPLAETAPADAPVADSDASVADAPALSTADLAGDWFYCSGPSLLDTAVSFDGAEVSTYIDDRPGQFGSLTVEGTDLLIDGTDRYTASVAGAVLTLTDAGEPAVYARSESDCPPGTAL